MKYLNTLSGLIYWLENGDLMMSKGNITMKATMEMDVFNAMIRDGEMVPVCEKCEKAAFEARVKGYKATISDVNIRFIAYCVATNTKQTGSELMAGFMNWIADRKSDYASKHPEMLYPALGSGVIIDQEHFTNFIVSGEWMK